MYLMWFLGVKMIKYLAQCLAHGKLLINGCYLFYVVINNK